MSNVAAALSALGLSYGAWGCLSLAMDRHHEQVFGHKATPRRRATLRPLGWLLLLIAAWPCVTHWGWSIGLLGVWGGCLSLSAFAFAFLLPYHARLVSGLVLPATLAGLASLASLASLATLALFG